MCDLAEGDHGKPGDPLAKRPDRKAALIVLSDGIVRRCQRGLFRWNRTIGFTSFSLTLSHMISMFLVADAMYEPMDPVASIICREPGKAIKRPTKVS